MRTRACLDLIRESIVGNDFGDLSINTIESTGSTLAINDNHTSPKVFYAELASPTSIRLLYLFLETENLNEYQRTELIKFLLKICTKNNVSLVWDGYVLGFAVTTVCAGTNDEAIVDFFYLLLRYLRTFLDAQEKVIVKAMIDLGIISPLPH